MESMPSVMDVNASVSSYAAVVKPPLVELRSPSAINTTDTSVVRRPLLPSGRNGRELRERHQSFGAYAQERRLMSELRYALKTTGRRGLKCHRANTVNEDWTSGEVVVSDWGTGAPDLTTLPHKRRKPRRPPPTTPQEPLLEHTQPEMSQPSIATNRLVPIQRPIPAPRLSLVRNQGAELDWLKAEVLRLTATVHMQAEMIRLGQGYQTNLQPSEVSTTHERNQEPSELESLCEVILPMLIAKLGREPLIPSVGCPQSGYTSDELEEEESLEIWVDAQEGGDDSLHLSLPETIASGPPELPPTGEAEVEPVADVDAGGPAPEPMDVDVDVNVEDGEPAPDYCRLIDEFDEWIHMRTQFMKRDKAFLTVLPGLMQRWLKMKKIEDYPKDFTDGLMEAATRRVKPSITEVRLSQKLADPETRGSMRLLNEAMQGEVNEFNVDQVADWCAERASRVYLWWFTFWLGWSPMCYIHLWQPSWWLGWVFFLMWDIWHRFCWWWYESPPEIDIHQFEVPLLRMLDPSFVIIITFSWYLLVEKLLTIFFWYGYYGVLRRVYFREVFMKVDFTADGWYRSHNSMKLFQPGNVKSQ